MKDPAFLFYSDNFLSGTMFFTDEQTGKYIRLLCAQHLTGHLKENHMIFICKSFDKDIWDKFIKDENGLYYNERLELEIIKRRNYSESRSNNKKGKIKLPEKISKSYDFHMGNENGNEKEDINVIKKFIIPDIESIKKYCIERKNKVDPEYWFNFYSSKGWMIGKNKMKDWKAAIRTWEKYNSNEKTFGNNKPDKNAETFRAAADLQRRIEEGNN